ncbi:hypothetical protein GW17_00005835 [Ensete ventricosum]|nr:hypothetical protein GW17_00005835 [Ensete ventricosum]RZR80975.1 hypothetical protein BHM03_00007113 [Ensete ventricosum]
MTDCSRGRGPKRQRDSPGYLHPATNHHARYPSTPRPQSEPRPPSLTEESRWTESERTNLSSLAVRLPNSKAKGSMKGAKPTTVFMHVRGHPHPHNFVYRVFTTLNSSMRLHVCRRCYHSNDLRPSFAAVASHLRCFSPTVEKSIKPHTDLSQDIVEIEDAGNWTRCELSFWVFCESNRETRKKIPHHRDDPSQAVSSCLLQVSHPVEPVMRVQADPCRADPLSPTNHPATFWR